MESSRFSSDTKYKLRYIPQIFAQGMTGVNRKEFPKQGSGTANFVDGIPSIYSVAPSSGGKYVERADINGIGWLATQMQFFFQCGQFLTFDQDFCNDINGYPKGAILRTALATEGTEGTVSDEQNTFLVMSLVENNTTNFNNEEERARIEAGTSTSWKKLSIPYEALKAELDRIDTEIAAIKEKASKAYHFKGSVATYEELPTEGLEEGDVYNVTETGDNYAWAGEGKGEREDGWDSLGKVFDLEALKTELKEYADDAASGSTADLESRALLKKDTVREYDAESTDVEKVYCVPYINGLLSNEEIGSEYRDGQNRTNAELGYTARHIDAEFTKYFKLEKLSTEKVEEQSDEKVYTAKYVNDLETSLEGKISELGTSIEGKLGELQATLEGKIDAAKGECVAKTSIVKDDFTEDATDEQLYSAKLTNKLVQRLSDVEQRLLTVEEWIHKHGGSSDAEG